MTHYLYRNFRRAAIAVSIAPFLLVTGSHAQIRDRTQHQGQQPPAQTDSKPKSTKRGPRAIAVVEFLPGGAARLVPIALWIDDRYYDASLYAANPAPMALEPETVYEATDYGEPTGLFTVTSPKQVNGNWVADGHWKPHLAFDEKLAQRAAKQPKPKPTLSSDDDRPTLKRPGSSGSSDSGSSSGSSGDSASAKSTTSASSGSNSSASSSGDNDPDRPILKKPAAETPAPSSTPAPTSASGSAPTPATASGSNSASPSLAAQDSSATNDENDPNRPVLRRGKQVADLAPPTQKSTAVASANSTATAKTTAAVGAAQGKLVTTLAQLGHRSYPAISDAGKYEMRSLLYAMSPSERDEKSQQMAAIALEDIRKFTSGRNSPALPKTAAITDYDLRAFDLDYSNSPTLVLTAKLPVDSAKALRGGTFEYYVTVVAREDINGTPIKIFSSVTDSNHLDAYARMEIIDAVDADANGRGDLLFRQHSDVGISYSLYRVFPYEMKKVFEGGSGV